tara:strand:+ start:408 stop:614 length:207 start_codon:yes stop_codon:yes gene_type:complete
MQHAPWPAPQTCYLKSKKPDSEFTKALASGSVSALLQCLFKRSERPIEFQRTLMVFLIPNEVTPLSDC